MSQQVQVAIRMNRELHQKAVTKCKKEFEKERKTKT